MNGVGCGARFGICAHGFAGIGIGIEPGIIGARDVNCDAMIFIEDEAR